MDEPSTIEKEKDLQPHGRRSLDEACIHQKKNWQHQMREEGVVAPREKKYFLAHKGKWEFGGIKKK